MRLFVALAVAAAASAQPGPFTIDQVLGHAFPSELTASPAAGKFAWVSNSRGVRNIMVAAPPMYQGRKITSYSQDDGQDLTALRWTADNSAIVYVRGAAAREGIANPTLNPKGAEEAIWIVPVAGGPPQRIAEGNSPAISPKGGTIAFISHGQVWFAPNDGKAAPAEAFQDKGEVSEPVWSPDGTRLAFTSSRGDHSLIGIYNRAAGKLLYLDPSTDYDSNPEWSVDGQTIAFIRQPSDGLRPVRQARREGEPWSIRIASAETGEGHVLWTAKPGPGSVFRRMVARNQLLWAANGRLVFPWEGDGWLHLYSIAAAGGAPLGLTPGAFEIEHVALTPDRRLVIYSSNQDDLDRRHIWQVDPTGGGSTPLTSGDGIEVAPAPGSGGAPVAFLASDGQHPLHVAAHIGPFVRSLDPSAQPPEFPLSLMVKPQAVTFNSSDGLTIHGQIFLPANRDLGAPAIVFFHGGSQRQMLLGWHYMMYYSNAYAMNEYLVSRGYIVLSVNYRSGIGYGLNFREALHYGPSGASEYNDVKAAGEYLRSRADVDPSRIAVWGGSYGGYLTAMALARDSETYKAGVDFHGVHDWAKELRIPPTEPDYKLAFESSPMNFLKTWKSPVLLIAGDNDPDVQFNQTVMLADALRKQGVKVDQQVFPGEVHDFLLYRSWRDSYMAAARFFERWLMK